LVLSAAPPPRLPARQRYNLAVASVSAVAPNFQVWLLDESRPMCYKRSLRA
jgi:hypothetical protein